MSGRLALPLPLPARPCPARQIDTMFALIYKIENINQHSKKIIFKILRSWVVVHFTMFK
jgi:hypothetical protein